MSVAVFTFAQQSMTNASPSLILCYSGPEAPLVAIWYVVAALEAVDIFAAA